LVGMCSARVGRYVLCSSLRMRPSR
jgi:hypothetical protein